MRIQTLIGFCLVALLLNLACEEEIPTESVQSPIDPASFLALNLSDETKFVRDYEYQSDILVKNQRDQSAYKKEYSYKEFEEIYQNAEYLADQSLKSIMVDDDLYYYSIYEILHRASDLVYGKVTKVEPKWGSDDDADLIFTHTTVEIYKSMNGCVEKSPIEIIDLGGALDGFTSGSWSMPPPDYQAGELVFIPLQIENSQIRTFASRQGKFTIIK